MKNESPFQSPTSTWACLAQRL